MGTILVFGSNLAGKHDIGAASYACQHYGAVYGQASGPQGKAALLPLKTNTLDSCPCRR